MQKESIYNKMTKSERLVAELLKNLGIKWVYERPIFVWDGNKRPRVWTPDFYLIPFGVYVEVCGSRDFNYKYRREILDKNRFRVIFLHLYKNKQKWKYHFMDYLEKIMDYRYKKLNEIIRNKN